MSSRADDIVHALPARLPRDLLSAEGTIPVPTEEPVEEMDRMKERVDVLHAQFERQAEATPDLLALSFYASLDAPPIDLTYAELDARANGLASVLREEDAEVIPICMQRSVELYVAASDESRASEILTEQDPATCSWLSTLKEKLTNSLHGDLRPKNTSYILPATPVQESLLVETMIEPGAYWSHRIFDLGHLGEADTARLKAAWTAAASHVDILRTAFCPLSHFSVHDDKLKSCSSGQWAREHGIYAAVLQLVLDTPYVHWTTLHNADAETLADLAKQIHLELAPLGANRARSPWAVTFSEANSKMMLSMHHALHNAESSSILLDMVARLYRDPQQSVAINSTALQMARGMELGLLPSMSQRNEACSAWRKRLHGLVETDGALNSPFPDLTGSRQKSTRTILSAKASVPSHLLEARRTGLPDLPRLMQSAFGCILAAVLELRTVIFGQTVSQRVLHPDVARVVGPAMATLPVVIRAHVSTAAELWTEMNRDASSLSAIAHCLHPVDLKKMINEGSGESNARFPALFVYHPILEAGEGVVDAGRAVFKEVGQALSLNVEHPMALNIFEVDNTVELTGDSRVISQAMLDLMLQQILNQARVMLENPNLPLNQLQNYMDRELVATVGESATFVGKDIATNPAALVTKQATEHPEWIAVEEIFLDDDDDGSDRITTETLTYRELEVLVNAIASKLTSHEANLQPGDVVALYLERDIKSLAAIIAIFKCGYIYLPIDEGLPSARKQLLVHDAHAKLVVTTEDMVANLDLLPARDPPALFLPQGDDELEVLRSWPDTVSGSATNTGADGGYLLYTSGSTGRPKGVQVTNESLLHWISAMTKCLIEANAEMADLGGAGKYLNVASRAFDTHLTSMFAPWHLGFRSVIGKDRDGIFGSLQQVVNTVGITNMGSVPSVLLQLGLRLADMPSIRILTIGGEKASHELFEQLTAGNPKAALMNFYGPTEATVGCLSHVVGYHSNARNLGLPLPGLQALLLVPGDGDEQVVARKGEPGEFCIAGPQVAIGYIDRPEENAKAFQYTTLLGGARMRIYRTGHMMRMMHDGTVEFLGRKDQQTKIRGQRFEIGEVEAYIKKVIADQGPLDVAAAVVDQRLLGFLARRRNTLLKAEVDAEPELITQPIQSLRAVLEVVEQACQREFPAFMVPDIMWVSKIPLLAASGKTDAKLLVKLGQDFLNVLQGSDATRSQPTAALTTMTQAEREVLAALEEVMGKQVVATPANVIRNLGIDSLSGMHLLSALKKRGFVKVSLANLLSPSCSVGSLAKEMTLKDLGPGVNGLTEDAITAILPCLPLQSSLVALSLNWLQSDDEAAGVDPPYVTDSRPPVRLQITDNPSSGKTTVSLKIHHALYDGAAITMFRNKIERAYARDYMLVLSDQQSLSTLQRLAIHCDLTHQEMKAIKSSWKTTLLGVQPCRVGAGVGESKQATTNRAARRLAYTAAELKTKPQRKDGETVSLSTALQLATTLCLASLTRSRCIVYGFTMSLRPLLSHVAEGINDFVGPYLNTIIHASILTSAHETLPHLIKRIIRSHADSCQGKMPLVGVDKIQRWAGVEEKLFDSLLTINVLPTDDELADRMDLPGSINSLPGKANIDMALTVDIDLHPNGKIDLALASAGVLTAAQLEGLAALFEEIVVNSANNAATVGQFASGVSYEAPQVRVISTPIPNGEPAQLGSQSIDDSFQVALSGVRDIACRLLSLEKANVNGSTSLYRLGLDSINVLSFVKLINKSEAIKITASAVLRARTLQGVAELIHQAKSRSHKEGHINGELTRGAQSADLHRPYEETLLRVASDLLFIATPLQEGMLSASTTLADQAYVYTHTMRLSDAAREQDAPRFERFSAAVRDIVQACEILRTRFIFTNDDDAPWVGVLKLHHAVYDANSIRAIWRLLNNNYAKRLAAHQEGHDELETTKHLFRPFARLSAAAQRGSIAFWVDTVQDYDYTPVEFSVDAKHASSAFYFSLSKAELSMLQARCREAQVSPKAAMQVAWAKLLCETIYKQADVVFGEVITASQDDDDNVVMGPTINTIPLRMKFSSQMGAASIGEALSLLQTLSDSARGENGRASLRAIQTAWRSSRTDEVDTSAGIFQSLFVYDGILSSADDESPRGPLLPAGAREQVDAGEGDKSPAYDDYPLIVSFRIRDGELHCALRTKMSEAETNRLGTQLEAALRYVVSQDLQDPALGSHLRLADFPRKEERAGAKTAVDKNSDLAGFKSLQDQAVDIVKKAVGSKSGGKNIALDTKLINVGLDSISAIRFSKMLRKQMGIHMSVFEIIRGASVYDIVTKSTSRETHGVVNRRNEKAPLPDGSLKAAAAGRLGVAENQIKTVSPVLSGQRGTLRQWLHSGKRFFEAPWAYRIDDVSVDERAVASYWESLCQTHEILRTTFVCTGGSAELVQVTFDGQVSVASRLTTVRDATISLQKLIQEHVRQGNAEPSDFTRPPARLSFIEALDGKAVVIRVHHALYDAWSIKMIQKDLVSLFDGQPLGPRPSVQSAIKQIIAFRQPEAEQEYRTQHLTGAADTILESGVKPANGTKNSLRSHFKSQFADVLPQDTVDSLTLANKSRTQVSVAVIVAYARALGRLTGRSRPTFGFNYSSRSLSSATGEQTLDLTSMSIPTMTVVPFSLGLETTPAQGLFEAVRNHLAQLAKFAQADDLDKISPSFNTHVNILYSKKTSDTHEGHTLQRLKLGEPLASEYFTKAAPSLTSSTVDILDTSFMPNQQLYFNVLVRQNGNTNVDMSGEEGLLCGDQDLISRLVESFSAEFVEAMRVEGEA
ncbi:Hydroxamate-type ferrichrome siderophore peptide synthetase [Colletotrichum kahawae]|uniref:Hydroxamate-type ferrichrome siderophore peptide synthetase n=1 Tax=Colletotrichum kahawae TaxID=34407 RepID=A0AAD9YC37_COLKA|nr:Hydroxamate-type ferrichrome siderophore peptide synthetase [Colletotrichum kahawae]